MGGIGSGRHKETETVCDVLMNEEQFKDYLVTKTIEDYGTVLSTLMDIITGNVSDYVLDSKNGKLIERPPSLSDRVKAAKVWKEMTLDKVVSDKKVVDRQDQQGLFDEFVEAVSEVGKVMDVIREERKKQAEEKVASEGKLVKLGGK